MSVLLVLKIFDTIGLTSIDQQWIKASFIRIQDYFNIETNVKM